MTIEDFAVKEGINLGKDCAIYSIRKSYLRKESKKFGTVRSLGLAEVKNILYLRKFYCYFDRFELEVIPWLVFFPPLPSYLFFRKISELVNVHKLYFLGIAERLEN